MQLEELLEPYLKDTDLGLPYWDYTKNSKISDLWENIPSEVKEWNEKRHTDFKEISTNITNRWRTNCQCPTMNIGEHSLRNNDLNILSNHQELLKSFTIDAMESMNLHNFTLLLEVKN